MLKKQLKAVRQRLHGKNLPKPLKKQLEKQLKALEKKAGVSPKSGKSGKQGKSDNSAKSGGASSKQQKTPGEEGN